MDDTNFEQAFAELFDWCRQHNFAGHDPFDALNSKLFQITPFKHSATARLLWTQTLKRSPLDLRKLAQVPAERNSKGVALFALAALANYRRTTTAEAELEARVRANGTDLQARLDLANRLVAAQRFEPALAQLIAIVEQDRGFQGDLTRKTMLAVFDLAADQRELVSTYRRRLAAALNR